MLNASDEELRTTLLKRLVTQSLLGAVASLAICQLLVDSQP